MISKRIKKIEFNDLSVSSIIESAQQIEVGIISKNFLPKQWNNPGVAGLIAYRVIADQLKNGDNSPTVNNFLQKIEEYSILALSELKNKGSSAFIKPIINKLMEFEVGFQRKVYPEDKFTSLRQIIRDEKISNQGQLAYHKTNKRFFLIVDDKYRLRFNVGTSSPRSYLNHAHCSLNDGMNPAQSQKIYEKLEKEFGICTTPIFQIVDEKVKHEMVYLNKVYNFSIKSANIGIAKTNSQMQEVHVLTIESGAFEELKQIGITCPYPDYLHHVTIGEITRKPHECLKNIESLDQTLDSENQITNAIKAVIFPKPLISDSKNSLDVRFVYSDPCESMSLFKKHNAVEMKKGEFGNKLHSGPIQMLSGEIICCPKIENNKPTLYRLK